MAALTNEDIASLSPAEAAEALNARLPSRCFTAGAVTYPPQRPDTRPRGRSAFPSKPHKPGDAEREAGEVLSTEGKVAKECKSWDIARARAGLSSISLAEALVQAFMLAILYSAYGLGRGLARWRKGKTTG